MEKTREQAFEAFKKANKKAKEKMALKKGFLTADEYRISLSSLNKTEKKAPKASKMKGTFYVIDILDATGSMAGGKYNNSMKGILDGIKDLTPRKDVRYSLIEFIQSSRALNRAVKAQIPADIKTSDIHFSGAIGGNTPLYKTVYDVIKDVKAGQDDKVLINVYTDGGNNTLYEYTQLAATLIKEVQKENFTVTFVATAEDLKRIKSEINIEDSNTLATANTAEGFKMSMEQTRSARTSYFAGASAGQSVLKGFYKKEGKL